MSALDDLKDNLALGLFGMTKREAVEKFICIDCKRPVDEILLPTPAARREYKISGLCEPCWDRSVGKFAKAVEGEDPRFE